MGVVAVEFVVGAVGNAFPSSVLVVLVVALDAQAEAVAWGTSAADVEVLDIEKQAALGAGEASSALFDT